MAAVAIQAVSSPGFYSSERIDELATPKTANNVWNFSRRLVSGNQVPLCPVSSRALMTRPTSRILTLAKPKKSFEGHPQNRSLFVYSCGRDSEIWGRLPALYTLTPTERILQLAEPRRRSATYLEQRPQSSPQCPVSFSALHCNASPRILSLAQPRCLHPSFTLPRKSESRVTKAARRTSASPRTERLAKPIIKKAAQHYDNRHKEAPIRPVSLAAQKAEASPRISELAKAKALPASSLPDRAALWPVTSAAKHAVATPRLEELAQPAKRAPTNLVQFDPEAFTVKESAKKVHCSDRIRALAQPIVR